MAKRFQARCGPDILSRPATTRHMVARKVAEVAGVERRVEVFSQQLRDVMEIGRTDREGKKIEVAALKMQQYYGRWLHDRIMESSATLVQTEAELSGERVKLTQATAG
jgi:hypothetical protein